MNTVLPFLLSFLKPVFFNTSRMNKVIKMKTAFGLTFKFNVTGLNSSLHQLCKPEVDCHSCPTFSVENKLEENGHESSAYFYLPNFNFRSCTKFV